jgi:hypothetical protein
VAGDVAVTGGTAGTFTMVDSTHATLVVTPTFNVAGTIGVSVTSGKFTDAAGNANTVSASATQDYNTIDMPPTVTISDNFADTTATGPVTFTFTFSKSVGATFTATDIEVMGGTAGAFTLAADAMSATLVVMPTASTAGTMTVSVPVGVFADALGTVNDAAASADQAYNTVDMPPTVMVSDNVSGTLTSGSVTFTFTFSKSVGASFTTGDIILSGGGTKGAFTMVDSTHATLVVNSPASAAGTMSVSVAAGTFTDELGTANAAGATATQAYNTVPSGGPSGSTGTCTASPCIDFSSASVGYDPFEGLVSAAQGTDPVDATNMVAKIVKGPAGQPWAGATIYTTKVGTIESVVPFGLAASKIVTLRSYSPVAGATIRLKLESSTDNTVTLETEATTGAANTWETLTFNFANVVSGTAAYNPAKTYDKVSVFPMFLTLPAAETAFYFDELQYTAGSGGGGGGGGGGFVGGVFAADYTGSLNPADGQPPMSTVGGDIGFFYDPRLPATKTYDYGGIASSVSAPGSVFNFYYGFGLNAPAITDAYFGAFVKSPGNAVVDVSTFANVKVGVWGPDQLFKPSTFPPLTVILQGPTVAGCSSASGGSEVVKTFNTTSQGAAAIYTLPLSGFTLQAACSGETTVAQVLAHIAQFNIVLKGTAIQYVTKDPDGVAFTNGLNLATIKFE